MAKREYPPFDTKDSPPIRTGHAKPEDANKTAGKGTSVADGERAVGRDERDPNTLSGKEVNRRTLAMKVAIGNIGSEIKPKKQSIKIRGTGAAERGDKCSDKMG